MKEAMVTCRKGLEVTVDGVESNVMRSLGPHNILGQTTTSKVKQGSPHSQVKMDRVFYEKGLRLCSCFFGSWNESYIGAKSNGKGV
jgi:hypothetical protein